jgi:sec-independent protein translocase protein TatA
MNLLMSLNGIVHLGLLGPLGTSEIIIIAIIILLLFGGKKIPELMKGLGKGVKNFKEGVKGIEDDIKLGDSDKQ